MLVSETKLDDSFPMAHFLLDGFSKPYRLDRCSNGGGILLYVKDDISSRLLTDHRLPDNVECLFTEINIRNKKLLLCCSYNPHKNNISNHIFHSSKGLDNYISHYDNILFLGDFNSHPSESCVNDFCNVYFTGRKFRVFRDFCPFSRKFEQRKKRFRLLAKVNPTRNVLKCGFAKVKLEKRNLKMFNVAFQTVEFLIYMVK